MNKYTYKMKCNGEIGIDVLVNSNCNLNCKYCYRRAPISNSEEYPLEQYKKDLVHLKSKNIKIKYICLTGGEPLLNKNLIEYIKISKEIYNEVPITILTNGMLIFKMSKELIEIVKKFGIRVVYTYYL